MPKISISDLEQFEDAPEFEKVRKNRVKEGAPQNKKNKTKRVKVLDYFEDEDF